MRSKQKLPKKFRFIKPMLFGIFLCVVAVAVSVIVRTINGIGHTNANLSPGIWWGLSAGAIISFAIGLRQAYRDFVHEDYLKNEIT